MKHRFNLIVFDWDGTLMDSAGRIVSSMRAAIAELGLPERDDDSLRNVIGLGLYEALAAIYPAEDETFYNKIIERYRHYFLYADETPTSLFPGAEDLLEYLSAQGHLLAVATGKGRQGLDRVLNESGLKKYFHSTRCADEAFSKPHPQMLTDIMTDLDTGPHETLMVGDTDFDMHMAKNCHAHALAVSYGAHSKERLLACQPLACVDTLNELHEWLRTLQTNAA